MGSVAEEPSDRTTSRRRAARKALAVPDLSRRDVGDELRFLRQWADNPKRVGAISPSGRWLARAMAAEVDPTGQGIVVELGPGTGVFTRALISRGVAPQRLVLVEYNRDFCRMLRRRFPGVTVVEGDAYEIGRHIETLGRGAPDAVVTGLPLLTRPLGTRLDLIDQCLSAGAPGMPVIQFSYAIQPPIPPGLGDYTVRRAKRVWFNLPPATVWVYSRPAS